MAKLFFKGIWYNSVSSSSMYEGQFESIIISHSSEIFPDYYVLPFKKTILSEIGSAKADIVLIEKNYKSWCIVEVELGHHSLNRHVIPQIEIIRSGKYGIEDAKYLTNRYNFLDESLLIRLFSIEQPSFYVFLNENVSTWIDPLKNMDFKISILEVFISQYGEQILRINGEQPLPNSGSIISICSKETRSPALLRIDNPDRLPRDSPEILPIWIDNGITLWKKRIGPKGIIWLQPLNRNPFRAEISNVTLVMYPSGTFAFENLE